MKKREIVTAGVGETTISLKKDRSQFFVFVLPLLFILFFLLYPIMITVLRSFMGTGSKFNLSKLSLSGYEKFFTTKLYSSSLKNSLIVAISVTLGTIVIGVPMGYFVARVKIPGKKLMLSLGILPMIMPSFIGAFSWIILLGKPWCILFYSLFFAYLI